MKRTTRAHLNRVASVINNLYKSQGSALRVCIESAYGHPRGELYDGDTYERAITSRNRAGIVYDELIAYFLGLQTGLNFKANS